PDFGNLIVIDDGNGIITRYAHCSQLDVNRGDVVSRGQIIAAIGDTGRSTGPHLHFEIRRNGVAQNPMKFLRAGQRQPQVARSHDSHPG
ncbi:MAG TPA: M23 family metallopeptidase, partial [Burkholderiales bacterium]|nr:M23 family metallopeptidase [Burkholderiales bacterium]